MFSNNFLKINRKTFSIIVRSPIFKALMVALVIISISLPFAPALAATSNLNVNGSLTYQTIDGMGVNINVNSWNNGELKPALDTLINVDGASIFRVVRDPMDWVSSESLIPSLHALDAATLNKVYEAPKMQDIWNTIGYLNQNGIQGNQITLNFQGWTPKWLGGSGVTGQKSYVTAGKESEWATAVASLVYYGRRVKNLNFTLLSPLNEPDGTGMDGPLLSPAQYVTALSALVHELDYMGLTEIRLIAPDTYTSTTNSYISQIMANSVVAPRIAHLGFHKYGGTAGLLPSYPAFPSLNDWITEGADWNSTLDTGGTVPDEWTFSRNSGDIVLGDLINGWCSFQIWDGYSSIYLIYSATAYSGWGLLTYNPTTGIYTPLKRLYVNAQMNQFIRPGMSLVGVSNVSGSIGNTVAIYDKTTGKLSIVGHNTGSSSVTINGQIQNIPTALNSLALFITNQSVSLQRQADVAVSGGKFTVSIPGDTFFSLSNIPINFDSTPPTVSIVSPQDGATVSGSVSVVANASDDKGVAGVQFLLDGATLGSEVTSPPFSVSWNTSSVSNGGHVLSAVARDTSGNEATSSIGVVVSNGGGVGPIFNFQQVSNTTTSASSLSAGLPLTITAGNLMIVSVSGWAAPATLTVSDNLGNAYALAGTIQKGADNAFCALYYAKNVVGGTATVTVTASASIQLSMTAAEFVGIDRTSPLGVTSGASGTGNSPSSGNMVPSTNGVLVIGAGTHNFDTVTTAGSGFTMVAIATEDNTVHQALATEYKVLSNTNPTATTFSLASSGNWMQVGALFKPAVTGLPDTTPPTVPSGLTAIAVSSSQVNLTWNPSTDDTGVAGYYVYRNGSQIGTTSTTSYMDTNLLASTTYFYSVAAFDAAGNLSGQSSQVSVTTNPSDTTPPTVPSGLTAIAVSSSQVNLTWNPSTDDTGVAGYYVYRNGSQIGTTSTTGFADTNLLASTTYFYTVAAFDAAGNLSGQSSQASVTTPSSSSGTFGLNNGNSTLLDIPNRLEAMRFLNTFGSGTLTKLELLVNDPTASGKARLGVYADNSGKPGKLLLDAGEVTITNGWISKSGLSLSVSSGKYYWLVFIMNDWNYMTYQSGQPTGSHYYATRTYGALPANFPTGSSNTNQYVIRATVQ